VAGSLTHIPHLQTSTIVFICSCLQLVSAVFSHVWAFRAYLEKCSVDKSALSTDDCVSLAAAPTEPNRAFAVIAGWVECQLQDSGRGGIVNLTVDLDGTEWP
jgi:hypothetical protein